MQPDPKGHTLPQAPQLPASLIRSEQKPLQFVEPGGQLAHVPWMHAGVDPPQTYPQAPQLFESEFTAVHVPLQHAADVGQQA
jgi:hypothetical protein